jgi:steroid 5-alpha reductase family enzyme
MTPLSVFFLGLALIASLLFVVWVIQLSTRNASLVDAVWSAALGLTGALYAALGTAPVATRVLLAFMAGLWGLRLAGHLALRTHGKPEDSRYAKARRAWGHKADIYLLAFFLFQALVAWILSLPFLVIAFMPATPPLWLAIFAVVVWLIAVCGEAIADRQLQRFKDNPANQGRVCQRGLWRYSRHPNYFFESVQWVSYVLISIGAPYWWLTLAGPVIMATLLLKVSGIPTIENRSPQEQREGYAAYVRTTSAFIPWPPRKDRSR